MSSGIAPCGQHRDDLAVACLDCRRPQPRQLTLAIRLFDWLCDRFVLTKDPHR